MPTILIAGGTGCIGKALTQLLLQQQHKVIILSRKILSSTHPQLQYAYWNISEGVIDRDAVMQADYIIHLAGANVAEKRWTTTRKKMIVDSRVQSSELIAKTLNQIPNKVKAVIAASATGWYGDDAHAQQLPFREEQPAYPDFLGNTCQQWEAALQPIQAAERRLVILRTGIVLSKTEGAFAEFIKPLRFGICPILGSGKQVISWIHLHDICNIYLYALKQPNIVGIYNAVAPNPVSNKQLLMTIRKHINTPTLPINVPSFLLKIMLGEMSIEVLKSCTASSSKIQSEGFSFQYPEIEQAVENLLFY